MGVVICFLHFWPPISILLSPCRSCSFTMTTLISFCRKIGQNTKTLTFNKSCWCFVPFIDNGTKSTCRSFKQMRRFLQPGYTQIHQVPGMINYVFVPFGNGWFIFGWLISRKFWRGCPGKHWGTHFHSNYPDMRCIQWMIYSKGKCWVKNTTLPSVVL